MSERLIKRSALTPNPIPSSKPNFWQDPQPFVKLLFIGLIGLILLIPLFMVEDAVNQRQTFRDTATQSITAGWGDRQIITGPLLVVPIVTKYLDEKGKPYETSDNLVILPSKLEVTGQLQSEIRHKGIFDRAVYLSDSLFAGSFDLSEAIALLGSRKESVALWNQAFLSVGINDLKGMQGQPKINLRAVESEFLPSSAILKLLPSGIHAPVNLSEWTKDKIYPFSFNLKMRGSDEIQFAPLGKQNLFTLQSKWADPSFVGSFLPETKKISAEGFQARWDISYLARNYPQTWLEDDLPTWFNEARQTSLFGVALFLSMDSYRNSERAVEYGILFILFVFLTYFIFDMLGKTKTHLVKYLLVGLAMCVFYLLLLSLSEVVSFNWAYMIATGATIALILVYSHQSGQNAFTGTLGGVLLLIYAFLFVILQQQEYALLLGSIATFLALATLMMATKNIDWDSRFRGQPKTAELIETEQEPELGAGI